MVFRQRIRILRLAPQPHQHLLEQSKLFYEGFMNAETSVQPSPCDSGPAEAGSCAKRVVLQSGITGVVLTHSGERLIEKCLTSLSFCQFLLVVDSGSNDNTLAIAKQFGAQVIHRNWDGFATQFTFAQTLVQTRWFFILDQDEICTPELAALIVKAITQADADADCPIPSPVAFSISRKSWYFNRFMKHSGWYPDHILRVFRTGFVEFYEDAHIHYRPLGGKEHISGPDAEIIHYPYTGFDHQLTKLNSYASSGARSLRERGAKGGILSGVWHGFGRFVRIYFLKKGFLDGRAGFLAACHGSFYAFLKYVRVLESSWGAPFDHDDKHK